MNIILDRVKEENKDVLYRLLEYSLFEESLNDGNEMNDDAIFEYKYFDSYFTDNDRDTFFFWVKEINKILGIVIINTYMQKCTAGHSIAEFMIIPKYRRNKIGRKVAFECFDMYKGDWEVSPSYGSDVAYSYWKKVIDEYTNNDNKLNDGVFVFNNK